MISNAIIKFYNANLEKKEAKRRQVAFFIAQKTRGVKF